MTNYTLRDAFDDAYWDCKIPNPVACKLGGIKDKNSTIFCVDKIFKKKPARGSRCDEFIVFDVSSKTNGIYLIERKSGENNNVEEVRQQLQGGANFIKKLSKKNSVPINNLFYLPVLVSKRASRTILSQLGKTVVTLNNQKKYIRHVLTDESLP